MSFIHPFFPRHPFTHRSNTFNHPQFSIINSTCCSQTALQNAIRDRSPSRILPLLNQHLSQPYSSTSYQTWRQAMLVCLAARNPNAVAAVLFRALSSPLASHLRLSQFVQPLRFLASISKWNLIFPLLDKMWYIGNTIAPDERLLVSLANTAVDLGSYSISLQIFRLMEVHHITMGPFSYSVLLKSHGRAQNVVAVKEVLTFLSGNSVRVDSVLLNTALDALVRCNDIGAAMRLLSEDVYAPLLDAASYNIIIKGFSERGNMSDAFAIMHKMKKNNCEPNDVTRNTVLSACVRAGEFDLAWAMLDGKYNKKDDGMSEESHRSTKSSEQTAAVQSVLLQNSEQKPKTPFASNQLTIALSSLAAGLISAGDIERALMVLSEMKSRKAPPSAITYASLISACLRRHAFADATRIFGTFAEDKIACIEVHNAYISGLCRFGKAANVYQAAELVNRMVSGESKILPNLGSFNSLLGGFVGVRRFDEAERILTKMENQKIRPNVVSYTIMMKGYSNAKQYENAKGAFRRISARRLKPDRIALNALISVCVQSGDIESGKKVLDYMETKKGSLSPSAQSYSPLISDFLRVEDYEKGWKIYVRMRSQGIGVNEYLMRTMAANLAGRTNRASAHVVEKCAQLLKDGQRDGVRLQELQRCRRIMLQSFKERAMRKVFNDLVEDPDFQSASEKIFQKHGWNEIDSGWRVL